MPVSVRRAATLDDEPLSSIKMTPMIDVLLVLLVMMILTMPRPTHQVPIDLPVPGPRTAPPSETHRITIAPNGAVRFDGEVLGEAALAAKARTIAHNPDASLEIAADATSRYEVFDQTLATIKRAGVTRLGFVGNERYADFSTI